jgi:hypothetical protein
MWCELRVQGQLDDSWSPWFGGLALTDAPDGEMVLAGDLPDQAALHGVLAKLRDLGVPLLALVCTERNERGGVR